MASKPNGYLTDKTVVNFLVGIGAYAHVLPVAPWPNKRLKALDNLVGGRGFVQDGRADVLFSLCGGNELQDVVKVTSKGHMSHLALTDTQKTLFGGKGSHAGHTGASNNILFIFKILMFENVLFMKQ